MRAAHLAAFTRGYLAPALDDHPYARGYGAVPRWTEEPRPAVSVVVPFLGSRDEGRALLEALSELRLEREGDEVVVVDNGGTLAEPGPGPVRVVPAPDERSSYYARNAGADIARNDWLLFLDADTLPPPSLVDDYFREPIDERCGAVAGGVVAARGQGALVARYAASRRYLSQAAHMRDAHRPYAITANRLVRRAAWEGVGGFFEGLRSGGDQDLCWRIQDAGWSLVYREPAAVEHRHRERVWPLMRQMARYSAAIAWMERRAPGSSPRPRATRRLVRSAVVALGWAGLGRRERALFKLLDGAVVLAEAAGYLLSNDAARPAAAPRAPARGVVVGEFPTADSAELAAGFGAVAVEALRRPERPDRAAARGLRARYAEDDGALRRRLAVATLRLRGSGALPPVVATAVRRLRSARVERLGSDRPSRARAALIARALDVPLDD
jgi:GT2 family glycosyltransferase